MERILQSHQLGPHRVDIIETVDDDGQESVLVIIDGMVVTEPPLAAIPDADEVMHIYSEWQQAQGTQGRRQLGDARWANARPGPQAAMSQRVKGALRP